MEWRRLAAIKIMCWCIYHHQCRTSFTLGACGIYWSRSHTFPDSCYWLLAVFATSNNQTLELGKACKWGYVVLQRNTLTKLALLLLILQCLLDRYRQLTVPSWQFSMYIWGYRYLLVFSVTLSPFLLRSPVQLTSTLIVLYADRVLWLSYFKLFLSIPINFSENF